MEEQALVQFAFCTYEIAIDTKVKFSQDEADDLYKCVERFLSSTDVLKVLVDVPEEPRGPSSAKFVIDSSKNGTLTCKIVMVISYYSDSTKPSVSKPQLRKTFAPFLESFPQFAVNKRCLD